MNRKIFWSSVMISILVTLASLFMITGVLFHFYENEQTNELHMELKYIAHAMDLSGDAYLESLEDSRRITLVDTDGTVLFDNQVDATTLDNHKDREEIQEAMENGYGKSIRYSTTLTTQTIYYAIRLQDGRVLRLAATQQNIVAMLLRMLEPALVIVLISVFLSMILAARISRSIVTPLNKLDLDHLEEADTYDELTPLLDRIKMQQETIRDQLVKASQMQEEFRLITENMTEGFLVIDKNTNLLTCNQAALQLLDISEQPKGSVLMLNRTREFRKIVNQTLEGKKVQKNMKQDNRTYSIIANPVYEEMAVIGGVIVILDVTESVHREELRREFTANVSHELKTPLTSISGFAELMMKGDMPGDTVVDFSKSIYEEAQRLVVLVTDIINLSSLEDGQLTYEWEKIQMRQLVTSICKRLEPAAKKRDVTLEIQGETGVMEGIQKVIDEMLYNLVDNAIKYNRDGGKVWIILTESIHHVTVEVKDNGIGIPRESVGRVFERFYRVDKSHSKAVGGTGLGLSIVKHGALYHHASIQMDSELGRGTSIRVRFRKDHIPEVDE